MKNINWKKLCIRLLYPPGWVMMVLTLISVVSLVYIFMNGLDVHPLASAAYVTAFYTLCTVTAASLRVFPRWYRAVRGKVYANPFGNRYFTDMVFKNHVSLYRSLAVNLIYVAYNLICGMIWESAWFIVLAAYYSILSVMRFLLLRYVNHNVVGGQRTHEHRRARLCAVILLTVNLSLSGAVLMMMYQDRGWDYPGMMIYIMAAYTFYITIQAIRNLIKYRKYQSPVMSMSKIITFAAALVSMLSLETAMLTQFGADNTPEFRRIMIAATGAGVSVIVVAMSMYVIVRACREIRAERIQECKKNGKQR